MSSVSASLAKAVDITRLPSLPQILFRLLDACEAADSSMADIAALIRQDAALSSRVLALVASPIYATRASGHRLGLEQALMLLGLNTTRTLALAAAVYQYMDRSLGSQSPRLRRFWHDALLAATVAEKLAQIGGYVAPHEAYLGALISNIGQIALLTVDPQGYADLLESRTDDAAELLQLEQGAFGQDHATLGALMLEQAGRRGPLADAVRFHHAGADELADAHILVRLVATANSLLSTNDEPAAAGLVAADQMLGLIPDLVREVYAAASDHARQACRGFGIDPDDPLPTGPGPSGDEQRLVRRLGELNVASAVRRQFAESDDLEDLLRGAHLAFTLIFGTHEMGYFLLDASGERATGHAVTMTAPIWGELEVRLPGAQSIVARVLTDGRSRCHYPWNREHPDSAKAGVLDLEVASLLDRPGLRVIALQSESGSIGAMAIGVGATDEQRLEERRVLMQLFAQELAASASALRARTQLQVSALETQAAEYQLRARSVAHEAKNPLSIINNYLAILERHIGEGSEDVPKDLRIIREEITRAGAILRSLTEAAEEPGAEARADLNTLIRDVTNLLRPTLITPAGLDLELGFDEAVPTLELPRNSVKQVLVNLLKNAAEALAPGQRIAVQTEDAVYVGRDSFVAITVSDNGPGIPPHVLANLFEPVASTKGHGHSGLGLSITRRLVDELGGSISCRSNRTEGTRFQILLPRRVVREPTP